MAWISVHEDVIGSKLRKLSNEIGCSQAEALGILNVIWLWGLKNADQSGELRDANRRNVAAAIPFDMLNDGLNPLSIVNALISTGWIDEVDGVLFLHDWDEWQEQWYKFLDRKAYNAKRMKDKRRKEQNQQGGEKPGPPLEPDPETVPTPLPDSKKPKDQKKPDKIRYAEFVHMTEDEFNKLVKSFGLPATEKAIEILDNYKGSKGKQYKDDYRTILNWVMDRVKEKHPGLIRRPEEVGGGQNPFGMWGDEDG